MINAIRRLVRGIRRGRRSTPAPTFRIEPLESGRGFRLMGALDLYTVGSVGKELEPELHGTLVLDLAAVDFMDDSGLGLLIGAVKRLREEGGSLVLRNPNDQILRVLEMTGLPIGSIGVGLSW